MDTYAPDARWGAPEKNLQRFCRKMPRWIGHFLTEAHEVIGGADIVWRALAYRSFRANGFYNDVLKQCILREVYHRYLDWKTVKSPSKLSAHG